MVVLYYHYCSNATGYAEVQKETFYFCTTEKPQ